MAFTFVINDLRLGSSMEKRRPRTRRLHIAFRQISQFQMKCSWNEWAGRKKEGSRRPWNEWLVARQLFSNVSTSDKLGSETASSLRLDELRLIAWCHVSSLLLCQIRKRQAFSSRSSMICLPSARTTTNFQIRKLSIIIVPLFCGLNQLEMHSSCTPSRSIRAMTAAEISLRGKRYLVV